MSGCALSISDEDAILIKFVQYFAYDIIREGDICVCACDACVCCLVKVKKQGTQAVRATSLFTMIL